MSMVIVGFAFCTFGRAGRDMVGMGKEVEWSGVDGLRVCFDDMVVLNVSG